VVYASFLTAAARRAGVVSILGKYNLNMHAIRRVSPESWNIWKRLFHLYIDADFRQWGEPTASSVPSVCSSTSAIGTYSTASTGSWPASQTPTSVGGGATTTRQQLALDRPRTKTSTRPVQPPVLALKRPPLPSPSTRSSPLFTARRSKSLEMSTFLKLEYRKKRYALSASSYTSSNHLFGMAQLALRPGTVIQ